MPLSASEWFARPSCITQARIAYNWTLVDAGLEIYPYDCVLMHRIHVRNTSVCPPIPSWSSPNGGLTAAALEGYRGNWTDTPSTCEIAPDWTSIFVPIAALVAALSLYSSSKHEIFRLYNVYVRRSVKLCCPSSWMMNVALSILSRSILLLGVAGLGAALGSIGGEIVRQIANDPDEPSLTLSAHLTLRGSYAGLGTVVGAIGAVVSALVFFLLRDCYRICQRLVHALEERRLGHPQPTERRAALRSLKAQPTLCTRLFGVPSSLDEPQYLLHPSIARSDLGGSGRISRARRISQSGRSSQRLLISELEMHERVLPIAARVARVFGFQQRQPLKGGGGGGAGREVGGGGGGGGGGLFSGGTPAEVLSNAGCQTMHLAKLLVHRLQRHRRLGTTVAFEHAVVDLHAHTFANYAHWRQHLSLPMADHLGQEHANATKGRVDVSRAWRTNVLLHELVLFYLIWGEAANLRHLPECLCCIYHCMRQRLAFPRDRQQTTFHKQEAGVFMREPSDKALPYKPQYDHDDCVIVHGGFAPQEDFLNTVVKPVYAVLSEEIKAKSNLGIDVRVMYDDVNETFWHRSTITRLEPKNDVAGHLSDAYDELRRELKEQEAISRRELKEQEAISRRAKAGAPRHDARHASLFQKTYTERVSFAHVLFSFHRVVVFHLGLIHILSALAFFGLDLGALCTLSLTHATLALFHLVWGNLLGSREKHSYAHEHPTLERLLLWSEVAAHLTMPILYLGQLAAPELRSYSRLPNLGLFELAAILYLLGSLPPLLRLTPSISELVLGEPFLGSRRQLRVPWSSYLAYVLFWVGTLGLKIGFDYVFIIKPLVEPTLKLWEVDLYCWHYTQLYSDCKLDVVDFVHGDKNVFHSNAPLRGFDDAADFVHKYRWLRMRFFNVVLIGLRWATPLIIMLADTILAYTLVGAIGSGLLGTWYRIGEMVEWVDVVRRVEDSVRLLNTKMLADIEEVERPEVFACHGVEQGGLQGDGGAVSSGAVSGSAMSGSAVSSGAVSGGLEERHLFNFRAGAQGSAQGSAHGSGHQHDDEVDRATHPLNTLGGSHDDDSEDVEEEEEEAEEEVEEEEEEAHDLGRHLGHHLTHSDDDDSEEEEAQVHRNLQSHPTVSHPNDDPAADFEASDGGMEASSRAEDEEPRADDEGRSRQIASSRADDEGRSLWEDPPASPPESPPHPQKSIAPLKLAPGKAPPASTMLPPRRMDSLSTRFMSYLGSISDDLRSISGGKPEAIGADSVDGLSAAPAQVPTTPPSHLPARTGAVRGAWTRLHFSTEARSREWQTFACVWNEMIRDLRRSDHLSNAERRELLFFSLGGPQVGPEPFHMPPHPYPPPFVLPTCPPSAPML